MKTFLFSSRTQEDSILDSIKDVHAVLEFDSDGRITLANSNFHEMIGLAATEVLGRPIGSILRDEFRNPGANPRPDSHRHIVSRLTTHGTAARHPGERWIRADLYATGLAEDPGSAVLTLTSLGLVQRSNRSRNEKNWSIGLWKDDSGKTPIERPPDKHGVGLMLTGVEVADSTNQSPRNRSQPTSADCSLRASHGQGSETLR